MNQTSIKTEVKRKKMAMKILRVIMDLINMTKTGRNWLTSDSKEVIKYPLLRVSRRTSSKWWRAISSCAQVEWKNSRNKSNEEICQGEETQWKWVNLLPWVVAERASKTFPLKTSPWVHPEKPVRSHRKKKRSNFSSATRLCISSWRMSTRSMQGGRKWNSFNLCAR